MKTRMTRKQGYTYQNGFRRRQPATQINMPTKEKGERRRKERLWAPFVPSFLVCVKR